MLEEPVFPLPSPVPAIISEYATGGTWRRLPTEMSGREEDDLIPPWVIDCVLNRR
jgi:hypothetical protein